ncbi:RICIN domain-containing protein [Enhygromyxa salina]|uniref:Ricin-type beta-trefoil lectin domain protein n=1 Tax=Enhygromyxa salina TaxID=215803 RepID=A0A2S9YXI3_9BACT|nr:RICIN domain-containing protein [Enhygromyxa salina]PRQ09772.1 Ricin-type beta-trefoil lectin domain protein [Enhygromyxa salina]
MKTSTRFAPLAQSLSARARRLPSIAAHAAAATLVLGALCPNLAHAGNDSDVSYEDIENDFIDNFDGGYTWSTKTIIRDGQSGTFRIGHDERGEPNIWDFNGSFFENATNRRRYVQRIQEWSTSDYLAQNPEYEDMVVTNFIAFNDDKSENDILTTWIYVNGVEIREIAGDYVSEELLEGIILSPFTDDTTISFKFKYDPAFTGSKTKTCSIDVHPDDAVFARSIVVEMDTGDWWTGDSANCEIEFNRSYGGEVEVHAGWDEDVCLNPLGNMSNSNGTDIKTYHCDYVTETWRYGRDMKIHAAWNDDLCLNMSGSNFWGGNVNLYDCDYAEQYYFGDDDVLHMFSDPDYCVNVIQSGVAWDEDPTNQWGGAGVNIYHCDWVIDSWSMTEL